METPHLLITVSPATSVVRYVRTARGFPSAGETIRQHVEVGVHLDMLKREDFGLLVDVREAPFNPSAAFETAIAESRKHLFRGFARAAVLVRTAVGALQLARHVREDGLEVPVMRDEQEALRFLMRAADAPPSSRSFGPLPSTLPSASGPPSTRLTPDTPLWARPAHDGTPAARPSQAPPPPGELPPWPRAPGRAPKA